MRYGWWPSGSRRASEKQPSISPQGQKNEQKRVRSRSATPGERKKSMDRGRQSPDGNMRKKRGKHPDALPIDLELILDLSSISWHGCRYRQLST